MAALSVESDDFDLSRLVPDQKILHSGIVWYLKESGAAANPDDWLRRRMWITDTGGLFYYSQRQGKPVGRNIHNLTAEQRDAGSCPHGFLMEVRPPAIEGMVIPPSSLAFESESDFEMWMKCFEQFQEAEADASGHAHPMRLYPKKTTERRRRSSVHVGPEGATIVTPSAAAGALSPGREPAAALGVPASLGQRNSQLLFAEKPHTALVLDWDDTIFPTTWVREDCGMNLRHTLDRQSQLAPDLRVLIKQLLQKLLDRHEEFLSSAVVLSNVFIVTLARRPWVERSAELFMPGLKRLIDRYSIPVIYAQEGIPDTLQEEYNKDNFKSEEQAAEFWTSVKAQAIEREIAAAYSRSGASWKNVISFGDSDFERYATISVCKAYMERETAGQAVSASADGATPEGASPDGRTRKLRIKTVKMLDSPTVEELIAQVSLLTRWLPFVVQKDVGFDLAFESTEDNAKLQSMHRDMTGESESLTWSALAGLEEEAR